MGDNPTSRRQADAFLEQFRVCVTFGPPRGPYFSQSPKNIQALADFNLTQQAATAIICSLTAENYCRGPEADIDTAGKEIWIFGCVVKKTEFYVKLRLDAGKDNSRPVVRSFHPAEHPLEYPFRQDGGT
jgi:hypothetical protein